MVEEMVDVKRLEELPRVPRSWWYSHAERGNVPHYRIGKYLRFRPQEIEAWLQSEREQREREARERRERESQGPSRRMDGPRPKATAGRTGGRP